MATTKKKRSSVPSTSPRQSAAKRSPRRRAPASQYTDVGQRRPTANRPTADKPGQAATSSAPSAAPARATTVEMPGIVTAREPFAELVTDAVSPTEGPDKTLASRRRRGPAVFLSALLLLVSVTASAVWRHQRQPESVADLLSQVSQVTVLPTHEAPVVSTVVDKGQVTQAFLASAKNGDKILLYYRAQKAIVYRPSSHQVITIGPIAQGTARVFIRDGGATAAELQDVKTLLLSDPADFTVASQDVSPNPRHGGTSVVDLTGVRPDVATKLAELLHAKVGSLPAGEHRPDGDLLVIVGGDTP